MNNGPKNPGGNGDFPNNSEMLEIIQKNIAGISYTLNNFQPVRCSYVGSDPFFFMDEMDIEDEDDDDLALLMEMEQLDQEIESLNEKLVNYERFSDELSLSTQGRLDALEEDIANMTSCQNQDDFYTPDIDGVCALLNKSRYAAQMLDFAQKNGVEIRYSQQIMTSLYDREAAVIFLNPRRKLPDILISLSCELRNLWQHKQGAGISPLRFDAEQAILVNRLQYADRAVSAVRVAWELNLADYKSVWSRAENSCLADIAKSFAREAFFDFRTINNGEAAATALESWFLSDRCRVYDRNLIQDMLSKSGDTDIRLDEDMSKTAAADLICKLGEMPFGKNYLAQYAGAIMQDPIFIEVRDRSNANFLWFVKFEKSFEATERELQQTRPDANADIGTQRSDSNGKEGLHEKRREQPYSTKSEPDGQRICASSGNIEGQAQAGNRLDRVTWQQHAGQQFGQQDARRDQSDQAEKVISFPRVEILETERPCRKASGASGSVVLFPFEA